MIWVNQIVQGVLLGGYYAVIACGLSFMFSVMRIINLAHGSLAIVAAFGLFVLADQFGVGPLTGLLIVLPVMALIGWVLQRAVLERSRRGGVLTPILSTFGCFSGLARIRARWGPIWTTSPTTPGASPTTSSSASSRSIRLSRRWSCSAACSCS
jgi:branched-subunit amino acid ABC-type transport system permease component